MGNSAACEGALRGLSSSDEVIFINQLGWVESLKGPVLGLKRPIKAKNGIQGRRGEGGVLGLRSIIAQYSAS